MTLRELADKSGVEIGTLSALEVRGSNRSQYAPQIARALRISVEELQEGGTEFARRSSDPGTLPDAPKPGVITANGEEVEVVELTQSALRVAKAFMDLPRNERDEFERKIVTAAARHGAYVPDSRLGHLAAKKTDKSSTDK